jgi:outer membrane protein, heavy metal efflux system
MPVILWGTLLSVVLMSMNAFSQSKPVSLNGLLDHIETVSPEILKARSQYEVVKQRMILAGQIPNPEVGIGSWKGKANGQKWGQTDISITQPIELGGKRSSRMDVAEAEIKQAEVEVSVLSAQLRLKVLFALFRYRQLTDEVEILNEATKTFAHLMKNYKNRPQLSPEQATTLFNFQLARNDYELKLEQVIAEKNILESDIKVMTGYYVGEIENLIPKRSKNWPDYNGSQNLNAPTLRMLAAQTAVSEKELQLAKADVWPTVNIGPNLTLQNQFGVLNQNDGAKAIAAKSIATTRKLYNIEKSVLEIKRDALLKTYTSSSKVLEKQADFSDLHRQHGQIEERFLRGLITSPLVFESHRQMVDNQQLYHDRELKTLEVYYQLVLLEGGKVEGF